MKPSERSKEMKLVQDRVAEAFFGRKRSESIECNVREEI